MADAGAWGLLAPNDEWHMSCDWRARFLGLEGREPGNMVRENKICGRWGCRNKGKAECS